MRLDELTLNGKILAEGEIILSFHEFAGIGDDRDTYISKYMLISYCCVTILY